MRPMKVTKENYLNAFDGRRCLVTGGLGFIGSNLAWRLVELGADVMLVDSLIPTYGGNLFNIKGLEHKLKINVADVRDKNSMDYLVRGQDYIFNLAGQISHLDSMVDPFTDLEINCRSQLSILEACRKNNAEVKIVYAGTRQIYGNPDYLPVDEKHLVRPTDVNTVRAFVRSSPHRECPTGNQASTMSTYPSAAMVSHRSTPPGGDQRGGLRTNADHVESEPTA